MITVIVCTHNPRADYFARTLSGLREQTLNRSSWELIIVDNASQNPISTTIDITWHHRARVVREDRIGLTAARLRGIDEAQGQLLIFVDDDNILERNYLLIAQKQWLSMPWLGTWGGKVEPEFETPPPIWIKTYLPLLAINEVRCDQWSNFTDPSSTPPCGAGMCVRIQAAKRWSESVRQSSLRISLGRTGTSLASGEDIDLAFTACDLGLATGRFTALKLTHLIPKERLELKYMSRLVESVAESQVLLRSLRENIVPAPPARLRARLLELWHDWRRGPEERALLRAERKGRTSGFTKLRSTQSTLSQSN